MRAELAKLKLEPEFLRGIMAFPKEYVAYLAAELAVRVEKAGKVKLHNKEQVSAKIKQLILDEFAKEENLNQEVRDHLEKYSSEMRRTGVSFQEMYKLVKRELLKKNRFVPLSGREKDGSKLSRDKIIELSHTLIKNLSSMTLQIELLEEKNEVRLEIFRQIQKLLKEEDLVDKKARQKILSQKREILEGSAEWDILFRKYYSEEIRKHGLI